jgi:hypothetical protein
MSRKSLTGGKEDVKVGSVMTPEQKLKWAILDILWRERGEDCPVVTAENVDAMYEARDDANELQDIREEVRCSGIETGIACDWSRHYESKAVAGRVPDGSWVGWTYWYGGGKHGEPQAIDWMGWAYDLNCMEEERMVLVRTFTRKPPQETGTPQSA